MTSAPKTVLIAEDDALIRMVAADLLIHEGFRVIEAEHAAAALCSLQINANIVALLFTDVHMPGVMDGLALAHHVRRSWPHIALLIASGDARPAADALPRGSVFITKPYEIDHVRMHAHELTSSNGPARL